MTVWKDSSIDVSEVTINDMSVLDNVLSSSTITEADISPEEGKIFISQPYRWIPVIPRLRDDKYMRDVEKQLKNLRKLSKADGSWKDSYGRKHKVSRFTIDNAIFKDAIERLGSTENLELRTGKNLYITNMRSGEKIVLDDLQAEKSKIWLSKDGRGLLLNSLAGDESNIVIANKVLMYVGNILDMVLAGRIPDKAET